MTKYLFLQRVKENSELGNRCRHTLQTRISQDVGNSQGLLGAASRKKIQKLIFLFDSQQTYLYFEKHQRFV